MARMPSAQLQRATGTDASTDGEQHSHFDALLQQAGAGDQEARQELLEHVYDELRQAAHRLMRSTNGHTMQPTALVNEVMLRMLERSSIGDYPNCRCFFSVAMDAMEKVLIDHARAKNTVKRGGEWQRIPLDAVLDQVEADSQAKYEDIYEALEQLKADNVRQYDVVRYRFLGGLNVNETAEMLGVSVGSVERDWRLARAKLYRCLRGLQ